MTRKIIKKDSMTYRNTPFFLRNEFQPTGPFGIPLIKRQSIDIKDIQLIACTETRKNDTEANRKCGVHFYVDDYHFNAIYSNPQKSLKKYSQYAFLLTPDFSAYAEMQPWRQIESVAHSRWCGAYWQSQGLIVIPTVTWGLPYTYQFSFDGIEEHSIVSVGMIGCKRNNYLQFMQGYEEMLRRIEPEYIICLGVPFDEMEGNIIVVDYHAKRKAE